MTGLGAWAFGWYEYGKVYTDSPRHEAGLKAFKQAIVDNGFGTGVVVDSPTWGKNFTKRVKQFQTAKGLTVDGIIGPNTAHHLFEVYCLAQEKALHIPNNLTSKQGHLESGDDPVAQGYEDSEDEGWAQLHMPFFPGITIEQAWTPSFAIAKLASAQANFYHSVPDWDGAIAQWNVGTETAKEWVAMGKPASGLVIDGVDYAARATHYVAEVKAQPA
jgi:hypothetical protein